MKMTAEIVYSEKEMIAIIRKGLGPIVSEKATVKTVRSSGYPVSQFHITIEHEEIEPEEEESLMKAEGA